jgi:hypothetical protein
MLTLSQERVGPGDRQLHKRILHTLLVGPDA